jgi:hypothetical protein
MNLPQQRPAETSAIAGAVALLLARIAGVDDPSTITAIAVVIGFIPAAVTSIVVWNSKRAKK